jgi:7,8-dihydro-6-hydroxymethylpterin-pyrophosphokinase
MHSTFPYSTLNSAELQMIIPQPTGYQHNFVIKPIFSVAKLIRNYPESLNAPDSVLHEDSETTDNPIPRLRISG